MKITIIRQYDLAMRVVGDLTAPNWYKYALRHDYRLKNIRIDETWEEANRKKLLSVRDEISEFSFMFPRSPIWFFYADADSVVTNPEIKLESFLEGIVEDVHLVFDVSQYGLSTGNWFARNTLMARNLLSAAFTCGNATEEANKQFASLAAKEAGDETTLKILRLNFPNWQKHTDMVKMADFPSTHTKESFVLHAAQRNTQERIALLSPYCS